MYPHRRLTAWLAGEHVAARLIAREYLPLAGHTLLWLVVALALGPRSAVLLGTANVANLAANNLTFVATRSVLRRRRLAGSEVWRVSLRRAWTFEACGAFAGLAAGGALALFYLSIDREAIVPLILFQAFGLPARYIGPLRERIRHAALTRPIRAWSGLGAAALLLALHMGKPGVAFALGLREWITLLIVAMLPHHAGLTPLVTRPAPPTLAEFAADTAEFNAHRMVYRIGKSTLGFALGPAGGILARTGRGFGLQRRLPPDIVVRRIAPGIALLGGVAGAALPMLVKGPGALLASANLFRVAFSAASAVSWVRVAQGLGTATQEDDDDDD